MKILVIAFFCAIVAGCAGYPATLLNDSQPQQSPVTVCEKHVATRLHDRCDIEYPAPRRRL